MGRCSDRDCAHPAIGHEAKIAMFGSRQHKQAVSPPGSVQSRVMNWCAERAAEISNLLVDRQRIQFQCRRVAVLLVCHGLAQSGQLFEFGWVLQGVPRA